MEKHTKAEIAELIEKFERGIITNQEMQSLNQWYDSMGSETGEYESPELNIGLAKERFYNKIEEKISEKIHKSKGRFSRFQLMAAACVATVCIVGLYVYLYSYRFESARTVKIIQQDEISVAPGKDKAILTLGDGTKVNLSDAKAGQLAKIEGVIISKSNNGQLVYRITGNGGTMNNTNKIETPAGGQYQVILPDGSTVILNALSSLIFPDRFLGNERRVELTGEAYFKVAKNKEKPFKVTARGQEVEVLGTQFNLNSYSDEPNIVTTLEEGSVRVKGAQGSRVIAPGQQSLFDNGNDISVRQANLAEALAWKNGEMVFDDAELPAIMRQVSRWYNIQIRYEGYTKGNRITGSIGRDANLNTLLRILKGSGVKVRMEESVEEKTLVISE
jgi:hypothetical protein